MKWISRYMASATSPLLKGGEDGGSHIRGEGKPCQFTDKFRRRLDVW